LAIGIGSKVLNRAERYGALPGGGRAPDQYKHAKTEFRRVDINTASLDELTALPGIGPKKARAIVAWREKKGQFENVEQLTSVRGIGEKTLASVRAYVYVKDRSPGRQ
jgi:competence protein ComEA